MLMRGAVVTIRQRRSLTGLALARGGATAGNTSVESACLDLLLDEPNRGIDTLADGPGDLCLHRDREEPPDVLEQGAIGLREVVRIRSEPLHRPLTRREHLATVLEVGISVHVGVD